MRSESLRNICKAFLIVDVLVLVTREDFEFGKYFSESNVPLAISNFAAALRFDAYLRF